jgi:hypothetical protein
MQSEVSEKDGSACFERSQDELVPECNHKDILALGKKYLECFVSSTNNVSSAQRNCEVVIENNTFLMPH